MRQLLPLGRAKPARWGTRMLAFCAAALMFFTAFVAVRGMRVAAVSAATAGNLELAGVPAMEGCPLGPAFTFCNQSAGLLPPAGFTIKALAAVSDVSVSLGPVSGLSGNFAQGDFTVTSNSCAGSLAANALCIVDINFTPTTAGLREATVTVTDSAGDTIAFNIEGTNSTLSFLPPSPPACSPAVAPGTAFAFCDAGLGTASAPETFTLASTATVTGLTVSLAAVPGLASEFNAAQPDFTIESTTCGALLGASSSCSVSVAFTPSTAGLREAALTATDSQGDSIVAYIAGSTTTGLVIQPVGAGTFMSCLPSTGSQFCNEPSGGTTGPMVYTVENTSGTQVTGLTITPPIPTTPPTQPTPPPSNFTPQSTTCTPTLAAGASCTINTAFTPQTTGLLQGEVTVTDAQGDIAGLNLAGTADNYSLSLSNQSTELTVEQGQTATFKAQVTADNVFGANGEEVTFACPKTLPNFSTCAVSPCPVSMTPNATKAFSIVIVTSSKTVTAPPVPNPCEATAPASSLKHQAPVTSPAKATHFPPLVLFLLGSISLFLLWSVTSRRNRVLPTLAALGWAALLLVGCHSSSTPTTATPTGTYSLTVTGNALDANGNAINASRPLSFTLDVISNQ